MGELVSIFDLARDAGRPIGLCGRLLALNAMIEMLERAEIAMLSIGDPGAESDRDRVRFRRAELLAGLEHSWAAGQTEGRNAAELYYALLTLRRDRYGLASTSRRELLGFLRALTAHKANLVDLADHDVEVGPAAILTHGTALGLEAGTVAAVCTATVLDAEELAAIASPTEAGWSIAVQSGEAQMRHVLLVRWLGTHAPTSASLPAGYDAIIVLDPFGVPLLTTGLGSGAVLAVGYAAASWLVRRVYELGAERGIDPIAIDLGQAA